jgi:hypothetical protein
MAGGDGCTNRTKEIEMKTQTYVKITSETYKKPWYLVREREEFIGCSECENASDPNDEWFCENHPGATVQSMIGKTEYHDDDQTFQLCDFPNGAQVEPVKKSQVPKSVRKNLDWIFDC